ncbi:helix-turn-helix domain-containing protein [Mesorhizobium sp. B2-4-13]|uniref:helix-turn-helix domain-containing protein n=1 Tax=Mesorhizobium sp. B2-4-13 TaxID=2589936 RepID=UPI001150D924|nr:helix-turn-helix transcriptional regulator [Mesorhizobium sp. B2-4-13]TPK87016.1 helix-turn-helix domain-containing protein [Mesorhizobium sp. B2-4-13]
MSEYTPTQKVGAALARLRVEASVTQAILAEKSGLDQSRISRIEKGEVVASADVDRALEALEALGAPNAKAFKEYAGRDWQHIEPPSFWNPERTCLEITEETLDEVETFLTNDDHPWPLRRQIERQRDSLLRAASFLGRLSHNVAFIGDMGVGKSTAISFIFDLLVPTSLADKAINRPVLETGAGGTTICEVHIKGGPEFGISLLPMSDAEMRETVSDFCAAKWVANTSEGREAGESVGVSREAERAIRNMSGLGRKRETVEGKIVYQDPVIDLAKSSSSEDEFRTRVLALMNLDDRTRRELWYDSSTRKHPMEWVTETFKAVNNGRLKEVPLPKSIDLLIPNFGRTFGELEITVIDTKGVDDVAVREDLDHRLKDPRTGIVFCSRFNDAPGTSTRVLLQHMRQTFSDRFDTGKVSILALPRSEEARAMKDDIGEQALTDSEGYEFKQMQVSSELSAEDLAGVPMLFYNVEADDAAITRSDLFGQLSRMRKAVEERLFDLCAASQDIIKNHEAQALNAAIEEVANRLNTFLRGNRALGARERLAHVDAISTIKGVRYASTLWASTRRGGDYTGLNVVHLVGVGAARDAKLRSESWFNGLNAFLKSLKADEGLSLAIRSIDQIAANAAASKRAFLEAAQLGGVEVYREPLSQSPVWSACASEWGRGPGFKLRVADRLENWFAKEAKLKDRLEQMISGLWEQTVIAPLERLVDESAPEADPTTGNVIPFKGRMSA